MNLNLNIKKFLTNPVKGQSSNVKGSSGFTLLELLIVVSIIAILSVALVLVLNPAEALRKSRDSQRMSDLATMKTAIALYLTSTTTPFIGAYPLGTINTNAGCKATPTANATRIYYSSNSVTSANASTDGYTGTVAATSTTASSTLTDGTGWIPVNFDSLTGGSPISNLPIDPVNTVGTVTAPNSGDFVYRYACSQNPLAFEIDAILESTAYASTSPTTDGGNNSTYYEVGTNLKIIGNSLTF